MPMLVCVPRHAYDSQRTAGRNPGPLHLMGLREQIRVLTASTFTVWPISRALKSMFYAKAMQSAMKRL